MDQAYAAAYEDLYKHHWWWRVREEILLRRIQELLAPTDGRARILDVGCGAGFFFDALERFGHVEGIESDAFAIQKAGRWRARIVQGTLDATYRPSRPFTLILMLDVLEHIHDPGSVVRRASEILEPQGRILITVPAFDWIWTHHDDLNHHLRRYTAVTLRHTIAESGLATVEMRYLFQSLVPLKLLVRAKETLMSSPSPMARVPAPIVNAGLQAWCRAESRIASWLPFGSSLMAVAARSDAGG